MSTTFDVYPATKSIPTFDEVLRLSNIYLKEALAKQGITHPFQIDVFLQTCEGDIKTPFLKSEPAKWTDDLYAWFHVKDQPGGTDAYFCDMDEDRMDLWNDYIADDGKSRQHEQKIRNCLKNGRYWTFRRSMGQTCLTNLMYGMVAAAFAKLTNGFIHSDDSAWDYSLFPVWADEFVLRYFDPNCPDPDMSKWAKNCFECIKEQFPEPEIR